jgi:hypothetical protein
MAVDLDTVYRIILKAASIGLGPSKFQIMVIGYLRFFNADTDQCDNVQFGLGPGAPPGAPRMTKSLRNALNALVDKLNGVIRTAVNDINQEFHVNRFVYVEVNSRFDGHRFCEQGVNEPDRDNTNTWFFHVFGDDSPRDVESFTDSPITLSRAECNAAIAANNTDNGIKMARYIRNFLVDNAQVALPPYLAEEDPQLFSTPEIIGKAFHAKTRGYQSIVEAIEESIQESPDPGLSEVLIYFQGTKEEFNDMISNLPATSVPAESTKISYDTFDLRVYGTRLHVEEAFDLQDENDKVLGVEFRPQAVTPASIQNDTQDLEAINNTSFMGNFIKRDFITKTDMDLDQDFDEKDVLTPFSDSPTFKGQKFWKYPGYLHDPARGRGAHVYIIDSGINRQYSVRPTYPMQLSMLS